MTDEARFRKTAIVLGSRTMSGGTLLERIAARANDDATRFDMADIMKPLGALPAPAFEALLDATEKQLGFALPPQLRRVYLEVGNGGFGPGYGLIGARGGHADDGRFLVESYKYVGEGFVWPRHLLPVVNWGCLTWSCVDCSDPRAEIVHCALEARTLARSGQPFEDWLAAWADGTKLYEEMFEPGETIEVVHRVTKKVSRIRLPGPMRGELSTLEKESFFSVLRRVLR